MLPPFINSILLYLKTFVFDRQNLRPVKQCWEKTSAAICKTSGLAMHAGYAGDGDDGSCDLF